MPSRNAQATPSAVDATYPKNGFTFDARSIRPQIVLFLAGLAAVVSPFLPWLSVDDAYESYHLKQHRGL